MADYDYDDDVLHGYKLPTADEIEITIPVRRAPAATPKVESGSDLPGAEQINAEDAAGLDLHPLGSTSLSAEEQELERQEAEERLEDSHENEGLGENNDRSFQGGGAAGGAAVAGSSTSGAAVNGSAGAEPVPQRDDPDEGEHSDSTEAQAIVRAQKAAQASRRVSTEVIHVDAEPELKLAPPAPIQEYVDEPAPIAVEVESLAPENHYANREHKGISGNSPTVFQKVGFSVGKGPDGKDLPTLIVKPFPQVLVDRLRMALVPAAGGTFADALAAPALITAFLMAKTGIDLDVDPNTAIAVDIFRQVDPRLLAVEEKIDELMSSISKMTGDVKSSVVLARSTSAVVEGMEFATAYLLADRVVGLTTSDVNEATVDVTQPKVLAARESIRKRSGAQRTLEKQREGRNIVR